MNTPPQVVLLIDADNLSADVMEQAVVKVLAEHGAIHVRRAYCTAESAVKHQKLFKQYSIRPIVNLSTGKNSTDISLAVDAIDLVISERPSVVVIASSDSDFAPLVLRLREKGCRVCGIGQEGKTGDDSPQVYDEFVDLVHRKPKAASKAPAKRAAAPKLTKAAKATAPVNVVASPNLPDEVLRILDAVPELRRGDKLELGFAAEKLRAAKLLAKSGSSPKLFKKYSQHFVLTPDKQPNKVQFTAA